MELSGTAHVLRLAALCTTVLLAAAACGSDEGSPGMAGQWTGPAGVELTLDTDGEASGNDGCNAFGGSWKATNDTEATFELGRSTLVACEDAGWTDPAKLTLARGNLIVKDSSGATLSTLEPAAE